jgi:hypothetical protein
VYTAIDHSDAIRIDDRVTFCVGLGTMLASLPDDQRMGSFEAMWSIPISRLDRLTHAAKKAYSYSQFSPMLSHIGDEIRIVSALSRSFAIALSDCSDSMENGYETSHGGLAPISDTVLELIQRGWPNIAYVAETWADDEVRIGERELLGGVVTSIYSNLTNLLFSP